MFLLLLISIFFAMVAFYFYAKKCNHYWDERGVVTFKNHFIWGTVYEFATGRRSFEEIYEEIYRAEPEERFVGTYNMLKPVLFIRDPELIRQITVNDFSYFIDRGDEAVTAEGPIDHHIFCLRGDEWKTVRNKLNPAFSVNKVKKMYNLVEGVVEKLVKYHFGPAVDQNEPVDVREIMLSYSLDAIGCCAFGLQFNAINEPDSRYKKVAQSITDFSTFRISLWFALRIVSPNLVKWLGFRHVTHKIEKFFFDLVRDAEELRSKESIRREDLLQLMLDIKNDQSNEARHLFTDSHIAANVYGVLIGSYDNTANITAFILYELAMHPEIQEKLRHEIREAQEANDGVMDYDTVNSIAYLEMVLSETMRLHTPVPISGRRCVKTYQIPNSTCKIEPGVSLSLPVSALHHDEKYFPFPEKFDPERFSKENIARRNPYVYHPFGSGPRICLASTFGKFEIKICLVHLLLRFKFSPSSRTENPIILDQKASVCKAKNGVHLTVTKI